jgi:hypothetical protein
MSRTESDAQPRRTDEPATERRGEVVERRRWEPMLGPQQVLAALSGIAVIVAGFLEWTSSGAGLLTGAEGRQIPVEFLWDLSPEGDGPSLLILLIPIGVVAIASSLLLGSVGLRMLSGLAALVVVGVFAYQLSEALGDAEGGVFDHLDVGWYLAVVGGMVTLIAASVPFGATRRVDEVRTTDEVRTA